MSNAELCRRLRDWGNNIPAGLGYPERDTLFEATDLIDSLTARAEKAEAALLFYADESNWTEPGQVNRQELFDTAMGDDLGNRARAALSAIGEA